MPSLRFRQAHIADLERCFEIESAAYAGDEAATKEKILKRIENYPEGFLILENESEIIGFVNSGATDIVELSDETFKELVGHDPNGRFIVVMSVAIHPDYQRQGYGKKLVQRFVQDVQANQKEGIYLICQQALVSFYGAYGFVDLGPSQSDHGGLCWQEMVLMF